MDNQKPWYVTLFEKDWYDILAPGGSREARDLSTFNERTDRETEFVVKALALSEGASVLDLCCGWGRHAIRLAQRGLDVTGLDLSPYHIDLARQGAAEAGVEVEWIVDDMRSLPVETSSFDAVINLFTAFGYFDDAGNQQVLQEIARVLKPGGKLLIDVINRDFIVGYFSPTEWSEDESGRLILEKRRWDARAGRIYAKWLIIDPDGSRREHEHDERIYTLQELELRLESAGFRVIAAYGALQDEREFKRESRRLVVVAELT